MPEQASARTAAWLGALLLIVLLLPPAAAQGVDVFDARLTFVEPREQYEVEATGGIGALEVELLFEDLSRDGSYLVPGEVPPGTVDQSPHSVRVDVDIVSENSQGWQVLYNPTSFVSYSGETETIRLIAQINTQAENPFMQAMVNVTMRPTLQPEIVESRVVVVNFFTKGVAGFQAVPLGGVDLSPSEISSMGIQLTNAGTQPRTFGFEILENECDLFLVPPTHATLRPRETRTIAFTVEAPEQQFWYYAEQCPFRLGVFAIDNPGYVQSISMNTVVDGFWVAPEWVFWTLALAAAVVVALLLAKRRKERLEEEILGKPQKPWTIPVEQVYLKRLREKDPRAWYMVRHHLMEEEYQSALMWYKNYRKATRGRHTKERVVLRHERELESWRDAWQRRIARPEKKAARYEHRLQRRVDREAQARHKKALRKHKALVAKMKKAHEKKAARAQERYEKDAKKAAKKGREAPARPHVPEPDYPPMPVLQPVRLSEHKLQRKADKAWKKARKKQGDLEVRFERKEARKLHRLRRKARRIARKIDDPDFVADHPLLSE